MLSIAQQISHRARAGIACHHHRHNRIGMYNCERGTVQKRERNSLHGMSKLEEINPSTATCGEQAGLKPKA